MALVRRRRMRMKRPEKCAVYLNGRLIGFNPNGGALAKVLREKRRTGVLSQEVNIAYFDRSEEVFISTDSGRARRPYVVVEAGKSKFTPALSDKLKKKEIGWEWLIKNGVVEYLDAEEEENAYVAFKEEELTPDHTHLEIDPVSIVGVVVGQLPYPEYNSSPRITMACAMSKQSLGLYASNMNLRMDSRSHFLWYPQQPLCQTAPYRVLKMSERPAGMNFVVAITSYYGYDMGDGVVMNRASVDRGMMRSTFYRTYETEERRYPGGQKDRFEVPEPTVQGYREEQFYRHLGEDGIVVPEADVKAKDVLMGKTSPPRFLEEVSVFGITEEKKRENSITCKSGEDGIVDSVLVSESPAGNKLVKVKVRSTRVPELGDKFASRHGQKGVVGLLANPEDLPFTKDGIVPDLIINPHAIPSRMTSGHLLETLGGKPMCMSGGIADGTAFTGDKADGFRKALEAAGFVSDGKEIMYDGITGEPIEAEIFIGVVYYQKLHHLVSNKLHVRSRGPVQLLTHQPTEGRAREGGLRFGEMERDCLIGYGAAMLLRERMLEESDKTTELVCGNCGGIGVHDYIKNRSYCPLCESTNLSQIEMSYAFKLLMDEIKAIGIFPRLVLKDRA